MERITRFVELVSKIAAPAVGIGYVLGFLTVSFYLMQYGLAPVGLAKADYLAVGLVELFSVVPFVAFGFFLFPVVLAPWIAKKLREQCPKSNGHPPVLGSILAPPYSTMLLGLSLMFLTCFAWVFYPFAGERSEWNSCLWDWLVILPGGLGAVCLTVGSIAWVPLRRQDESQGWLVNGCLKIGAVFALLWLPFVLLSLAIFPGLGRSLGIVLFALPIGFWGFIIFWFSQLPNLDPLLWWRIVPIAFPFTVLTWFGYTVFVYPRISAPFGGHKERVTILTEDLVHPVEPLEVEKCNEAGIDIKPTSSGSRIGPAYVILEKPDSVVLSAFACKSDEEGKSAKNKPLPYIEIRREKIRARYSGYQPMDAGQNATQKPQ